MASDKKRSRLWVDPAFQSRLLVRMVLYLAIYSFVVVHVEFIFMLMARIMVDGPAQPISDYYLDFLSQKRPMLITLVLLLPVILYDLLKFSHRIAGPLFRCRSVMLAMAAGKPVPEFKARKHDLMGELFAAFNSLIREWNLRLGTNSASAPTTALPDKPTGESSSLPRS